MYDADEQHDQPDEGPAYDWDAWEKNRFTGFRRWYLLMLILSAVAMFALFLQNDGRAIW